MGDMDHRQRYTANMTKLLEANNENYPERVYLDRELPRVCIRGKEARSDAGIGYDWLNDDEIFPFFEMRAAAVDLRLGHPFDPEIARKRIRAQFQTCIEQGIRHVILSAFGCGAFRNPA